MPTIQTAWHAMTLFLVNLIKMLQSWTTAHLRPLEMRYWMFLVFGRLKDACDHPDGPTRLDGQASIVFVKKLCSRHHWAVVSTGYGHHEHGAVSGRRGGQGSSSIRSLRLGFSSRMKCHAIALAHETIVGQGKLRATFRLWVVLACAHYNYTELPEWPDSDE